MPKGFVKSGTKCRPGYKKKKVHIKGKGVREMCVRTK